MKRKLFITTIVLVVIILGISFTLLFSNKSNVDSLKVGLIVPLSGQFAFLGEDIVRAAELATKKYTNVHLIVEDDGCDSKKGVSAAYKLINNDNVDALIVACSSSAKSIYPITKKINMIEIALLETYIYEEDNLFQMLPPSWSLFYEIGKLGSAFGDVAIISTKIEVNEGVFGNHAQVEKGVLENGGTIVKSIQIQPDTTDFRTDILKLKEAHPSTIVSIMFKENHILFLKQYAELGVDIPLLGNVYYENDFDSLYSPATKHLFENTYSVNFVNNRPAWFIKDFQKVYDKLPGTFSEYSYDAIAFLAKAYAQDKGGSVDLLQSQLVGLQINGASGNITFNNLGNINTEIETKRFNGTMYVPLQSPNL